MEASREKRHREENMGDMEKHKKPKKQASK